MKTGRVPTHPIWCKCDRCFHGILHKEECRCVECSPHSLSNLNKLRKLDNVAK